MLVLPVSRAIKEGVAEIAAFLIDEKNKAREPLLQRIGDVERELAAVREAHTEANQRASNVQAQLQDKTAELDRVRAELQTTLQLLEERRALIQNLEKERDELASAARAQEAPPPLSDDKNDDVMMSDEAPEPILNPEGGFPESRVRAQLSKT
ncbi:hypothetical protein WOLCODRAFT_29572 [Wolfiporia cocos MD-104 SS10]|uniref:Uncharacterized protein n=1 Tax=Wolfiporia cocos (strain MD-104) TaxID=742152 RepID=A0A2H3JD01_WOLCO|nr:hypothetical protein WOLCODRAFT_29572 [Wolfiporia cocos MD-104 SS10]